MQTNTIDVANLVEAKSEAVQAFMMHHVMNSPTWAWLPHLHTSLPFGLTVHSVMMLAVAILLIVVLGTLARRQQPVPTGLLNAVEFSAKLLRFLFNLSGNTIFKACY